MTIYNKDGSAYRLNAPNPLMKEQVVPDDWHLVHNLGQFEEVVYYRRQLKPRQQPLPKSVVKEIKPLSPPPEPTPEPVVEVPPPPVVEEKPREVEGKSVYWCLPAAVKQYRDELYGEVRARLSFGDKFRFEAVPVKRGDMDFTLWTTILVPTSSILYSMEDRRWWRVTKTTIQDNGGFLILCMPSSEKPSFD